MATGQGFFRVLIWIVAILGIAFVCIQFIRHELQNPPVTADLQAPPQVKQILETSCYNCHSNETTLSWFDKPVPAYWLVVKDVTQGRKHLNFSEIAKLPAPQQKGILFESISQIELGAMPLPAYQRMHPESVITAQQLATLKEYLRPVTPTEATPAAQISAADAEYANWIEKGSDTDDVAPAPNGIAFLPKYKNWKAISSTERLDNHSLRHILGNDIAVKAIAEHHINPWPDGTAFAKVAWLEQVDTKGVTRPGPFFQVEFMIRDTNKYAATLGWGWARWRVTDLKPSGKDEPLCCECVASLQPLASPNYVFTM